MLARPSVILLHDGGVAEIKVMEMGSGSTIITSHVLVQPTASLTKTVYSPAGKLLNTLDAE